MLSVAKPFEHNLLEHRSVVDRYWCHMAAKFDVFVGENHDNLFTLYRLTKPYKNILILIIANSSSCTTVTTELSILLIS